MRVIRRLVLFLISAIVGSLVMFVSLAEYQFDSRPDLQLWHTVELDQEFRADAGLDNFAQYLALEGQLFEQLDQLIYQQVAPEERRAINRYSAGSLADPGRWSRNWNRTFVLSTDEPKIGVLLLHGMSDSPYSMRSLGQALHRRGAYVIGMRIPGHGQAPSGLLHVQWEDMAAAVKLGMGELREKCGDQPLYMVGFSNGGALAVHYALESLSDSTLFPVDGLVLLSPEIGLSKLAPLFNWQERFGHLLGIQKLAWSDLLPEYDPWKYGSFALNAGKQAYRITREIQQQIGEQITAGTLHRMPRILAFQSVVDDTVTAPDLVHHLFDRLPALSPAVDRGDDEQHELVLFDINRYAEIEPLMVADPAAWFDPLLEDQHLNFSLALLSNKDHRDKLVVVVRRSSGDSSVERCDTGLSWPDNVYSLTHIALPFAPDDPVYGGDEAGPSPGIRLGNMALRGEKGVLQVSASNMLRLRFNPFYSYLEQRTLDFMGLETNVGSHCR